MTAKEIADNLPGKEELAQLLGLRGTLTGGGESFLSALGIFGAGLLVGAALGMLLAPKSGSELRRDLSERMGEGLNDLRESASTAGEARPPAQRTM